MNVLHSIYNLINVFQKLNPLVCKILNNGNLSYKGREGTFPTLIYQNLKNNGRTFVLQKCGH
jgi:hypothetical protein